MADFSPRVDNAWRFAVTAAQKRFGCLQRLDGVLGAARGRRNVSLADLWAWADRNDMALVDRAEIEGKCAELASLMAEMCDARSDFDRFLLGL